MLSTLGNWDNIKMLFILAVFMFVGTSPSLAAPGPEPAGWLDSLFGGGTELPATGDNLMKAAKEGNLETVKDLVARGADVEYSYNEPLSTAAREGHIEIVKYLLIAGANPNGTNDKGLFMGKVLQDAARNNHFAIIDLLLEAGASVTTGKYGTGVLDRAAENGHLEAVQKLLNAGADPNYGNGYSLLLPAKEGHLDIVKAFIKAGADVNTGDGWIIANAAEEGHLEVVKTLIDAGAKDLDYALVHATSTGKLDVVNLLLERGADPNTGKALKEAAENGHLQVARVLLEGGANINYDEDSDSALHYAASKGHLDIIRLLVEYGDDINRASIKDIWFDLLLDNSENYGKGWTVIHVAARFGHPIIKELLELGAVINLQDATGRSPLHIAAHYGKLMVVRELLKLCVDLTIINDEGKTGLDIANEQSQKNVSSNSSKYQKLMTILEETLPEKIASTPYSDEAMYAFRDQFKQLLETNATLKAYFEEESSENLSVYDALYYIFSERARTEMTKIIQDHNCKTSLKGQGIITIGTKYLASCECIQGQGLKMTLTPVKEADLCPPDSPPQEITTRGVA